MIPVNAFNVASLQVSVLPVEIVKIDGYFKGATADRWLQVWDTAQAPTAVEASASPACLLKEWPIGQTAPFYFEFKQNNLKTKYACFVGVSTTEGTWTASADTMDISVECETAPFGTVAANVIGGLAAGGVTPVVTIFANGDGGSGEGPGKLFRIDLYINNASLEGYLMLFAKTPATDDIPLWVSVNTIVGTPSKLLGQVLYRFSFMPGLIPFSQGQTSPTTDFLQAGYNGCYAAVSSSPVNLQVEVTGPELYLQAVYLAN